MSASHQEFDLNDVHKKSKYISSNVFQQSRTYFHEYKYVVTSDAVN